MIGFSPKGAIDLVAIFPAMLIIALVLDILGLLSIAGGTVLDVIGLLTIGLWIILRSLGERGPSDSKTQPLKAGAGAEAGAEKEIATISKSASKTAKKGLSKLAGAAIKVGATTVLEFVPAVNAILFGWTILVAIEFFSDIQSLNMETGE